MIYIGIDPGLSGGIAAINDSDDVVFKAIMPIKHGEIDVRTLAAILKELNKQGDAKVVLERVGAMPGQGVCAMFTFGKVVGMIIATLKIMQVPYQEVMPQQWKKVVLSGLSWKATVGKLVLPTGIGEEEKKVLQKAHSAKKTKAKKEAKLVAVSYVEKRWPRCDIRFGKKNPHDGVADALCMSAYGKIAS